MQVELNINIEFTTGKHPILGVIAFWMLPKKKIAETITEGIEKTLTAEYLNNILADKECGSMQ